MECDKTDYGLIDEREFGSLSIPSWSGDSVTNVEPSLLSISGGEKECI